METITWSALRKIGSQKMMSLTPLIPVFGHLILLGDPNAISTLIPSSQLLNYDTMLSPLIRNYILYYGLCFLAIGQVAFALRCPSAIKSDQNEHDFLKSSLSHATSLSVAEIMRQTKDALNTHKLKLQAYNPNIIQNCIDKILLAVEIQPDNRSGETEERFAYSLRADIICVLSFWYQQIDRSRRVSRYLVLVAYFFGFSALIVSSADVFAAVTIRLAASFSAGIHP